MFMDMKRRTPLGLVDDVNSEEPIMNPFGKDVHLSLSDLQEEMNRVFQRLWVAGARVSPFSESDWIPYVDVRDEPERVVVTAELPGVELGAVDLTFNDGALTISGTKSDGAAEPSPGKKLVAERRFGSFTRCLPMPADIEPDQIRAQCRQGVLEVVLPKLRSAATRSIKIQAES